MFIVELKKKKKFIKLVYFNMYDYKWLFVNGFVFLILIILLYWFMFFIFVLNVDLLYFNFVLF